jgi:hypothetical protein
MIERHVTKQSKSFIPMYLIAAPALPKVYVCDDAHIAPGPRPTAPAIKGLPVANILPMLAKGSKAFAVWMASLSSRCRAHQPINSLVHHEIDCTALTVRTAREHRVPFCTKSLKRLFVPSRRGSVIYVTTGRHDPKLAFE